MSEKLDPVEKQRRKGERAIKRLLDMILSEWDRQRLTPIQREKRLRESKAYVDKVVESRRGH